MPRIFSTAGRRTTRPGAPPPRERTALNDLFELFPELPRSRRPPLADQFRRMQENVARVQRLAARNVARHRGLAAQVKAAWLAKRHRR